jgi:hypothetical protein
VGREAQRLLTDERSLSGLLDTKEITRLVRRHNTKAEDLTEPLFALVVLAHWRKRFLG